MKPIPAFIILLLFIQLSTEAFAQDEETNEQDSVVSYKGAEGFHIGFYLGAFFPNKNSTAVYNGYGYDFNGNRNEFSSSILKKKIDLEKEYNPERIKQELGVNNIDDIIFNESDMPTNLKYTTTFLFGLALNYGLDKKQSIIANLNFCKLTITGNFTIETPNLSQTSGDPTTFHQFPIVGKEQRLMIQLGYSRILGDNEKGNFFLEAGLCLNNAKYEKNFIQINSLELDLTNGDQYTTGGNTLYVEHYTGWGFGAFAGFGLNLTMNPKYTIQFLYTPSYESVNLGPEPITGLQHAFGLRAYYNF